MATIEKLFVQIFERKRWIIEHLKQQKQLYDQHLASKLVIQGISPPSWLLNSELSSFSTDLSVLNKEELISGLLLPQPGPLASYPSGPCFLYDKPAAKAADSELLNELHATTCASSNGDDEDVHGIASQHHVDGTEEELEIVPPSHVDVTEEIPDYVPMSPEDQIDTMISSTYSKVEQSLARMQRSRSRQKALELRNSAKASAKSCLQREDDNHFPSGKETDMNVQQLDGLRESVDLVKPLALSADTCIKDAAAIRDCTRERRGSDTCSDSRSQSRGHETKEGQTEDNIKDAAAIRDCTRERRGSDTCSDSRSQSRGHETKEGQTEDNVMTEKNSDYRGLAESRSSCPQSSVGDYLGNRGSHEVYTGKMTRSRNGEAQQPEADDLQNRRVTKSSSDHMHSINEEQATGNARANNGRITRSRSGIKEATGGHQNCSKSHEVYVGRMTRSRSGNALHQKTDDPQHGEVIRSHRDHTQSISGQLANRNSKPFSGKITRSKSCVDKVAEAGNCGSRTKNEFSVQPKQLDFDEVEESCLADIQTGFQDNPEEKRRASHVQEKFASLPCPLSAEGTYKSLSYEKLDVRGRKSAHFSPRGDLILGNNSFLADCPTNSQITKEHELGNTLEFVKDPTLSRVNAYSHQKHSFEPGGQTLSKEATGLSLIDVDTDATINLHREATETSVSSEKIRLELSSGKVYNNSSHDPTTEWVQSSSGKASARSLRSIPDFPPASTSDEARYECTSNLLNVHNQSKTGGVQTSCFSSDVGFMGSKLQEVQAGLNVIPEYNYENATDGSWPCYKRRKIGNQLNSKSASPSVRLNPFSAVDRSTQRNSSETDQSARSSLSNGPQLSPEMQHEEGNVGLGRSAMKAFTSDHGELLTSSISKVKTAEPSDSFSDKEEATADPTSAIHCSGRECDDLDPAKDVADCYTGEKIDFTEMMLDQRHSLHGVGKLKFSVGSPLIERMDVCFSDAGDVPEYEGFIIAEKGESVQNAGDGTIHDEDPSLSTTTDVTSLLGQMCGSARLTTPVSPFPTGYKFRQMPGVYHSVPNGLLENIDLGSNQLLDGGALRGKSYSDYSFSSIRPGWDIGKPFISPLGKGYDGIASKSGGSAKQVSGNAELICFPIKEDPESSDEEVNVNDVAGTSMNEVDSAMKNCSTREPLRDIGSNNESSLDPSHAVERSSIESVTAEISVNEIPNKDCKKNELRQSNRLRKQGKENQSLSIGANSLRKHSESLSSRNSKPKLSGKSSLRSRGQSFSEKEQKRNNIVSTVKSFLPLVQQKQAAAALPAKREVKVKALEAAEAAKRLAEKRENERKHKKEALKLERARMEQENLKQIELKKKLKEEERKKREAANAEKKRQREEEERKEKERKRRRIEEARFQQQRAEEKLHAWRDESKCETEDRRAYERKDSNDKKENQDFGAKEENMSRKPSNELLQNDRIDAAAAQLIINDNKASTGSSDTVQVGSIDVAQISTPNCEKNDQFANQTSQEQSYDISPYQCSDDEEEDEDDVPNKKFIPPWASKNSVAVALSSLNQIDPDRIFPPGSFCSLEEVLLPRRLNTKMTVE